MCVDVKGRDDNAIKRLSKFIRDCGLTHFTYRCDQASPLLALVDEAIALSGRSGIHDKDNGPVIAAPEISSVGESQ